MNITPIPIDDQLPSSFAESESTLPSGRSVFDFLEVFGRRWKVFTSVFLIAFLVTFLASFLQKRVYESATKIVVATRSQTGGTDKDDLLGGLLELRQSRNVDTQVEVINSSNLLRKAFAKLPTSERNEQFGTLETPDLPPSWALNIGSHEDTDVIEIRSRAFSAKAASDLANVVTLTYFDSDLHHNVEATSQAKDYVKRELDRQTARLDEAAGQLANYKEHSGLVSPDNQLQAFSKAVIDMQTAMQGARSDAEAARRKVRVLGAQVAKTAPTIKSQSTVSENPEFTQDRADLLSLEQALSAAQQIYIPSSVQVTALTRQVEEQRAKIKNLARSIESSVQSSYNPVLATLLGEYADAQSAVAVADARLQVLQTEYASDQTEFKKFPEHERTFARLQQQVDALKKNLDLLSDKYLTLLVSEQSSIPNAYVVEDAFPALHASTPKVGLSIGLAFIAALAIALTAAALIEKLDVKLHRPNEVETLTGLPVLTLVPESQATGGKGRLLMDGVEHSFAFLEAFRLLRNNTMFAAPDRKLSRVVITSSAKGEGKSTVAVNFAISMAMDGLKVLIIDVDLRRPAIYKWFNLSNKTGWTNLIVGLQTEEDVIQTTKYENLSCLTTGPLPANPTEFLNAKKTRILFDKLATQYDLIVLDAPPCAGLSDMQVLSGLADGVVFVASMDLTSKPQLSASIQMLRQAGAKVLGLVVNRVDLNKRRYSYYGYYGYYQYDKTEDYNTGIEGGKPKGKSEKRQRRSKQD